MKRLPLPSDPPDPSESRRGPGSCWGPSFPLSDGFLLGLGCLALSPKRPRPPAKEGPLMAPASLLRTGEEEEEEEEGAAPERSRAEAAPGRNQSAQERQGAVGALSRSSMPPSSPSSCRRVAFTWGGGGGGGGTGHILLYF